MTSNAFRRVIRHRRLLEELKQLKEANRVAPSRERDIKIEILAQRIVQLGGVP